MGRALGTFPSDMFNTILRLGWWSPRPGHGGRGESEASHA